MEYQIPKSDNWTFLRRLTSRDGGLEVAVYSGYNELYLRQLVEKSRQEKMIKDVPRDADERFTSIEATYGWLREKGRSVFLLANREENDLAGIVWYGQEAPEAYFPEGCTANHTFAIRHYEGYGGKGFGKPFMKHTLEAYMRSLSHEQINEFGGIWLETCDDNSDALALYQKFGFEVVGNDKERVGMVLSPESISEILSADPIMGA